MMVIKFVLHECQHSVGLTKQWPSRSLRTAGIVPHHPTLWSGRCGIVGCHAFPSPTVGLKKPLAPQPAVRLDTKVCHFSRPGAEPNAAASTALGLDRRQNGRVANEVCHVRPAHRLLCDSPATDAGVDREHTVAESRSPATRVEVRRNEVGWWSTIISRFNNPRSAGLTTIE